MIIDADLPVVHNNGMFISAKVSRIVELIREHDSNLDVKWIPEKLRGPGDAAFAITEKLRDGSEVVAFYIQSEKDFDETVLARVYEADNAYHNVQTMMESHNRAIKAVEEAKLADERAQHIDLMRSMVTTRLHTYKHNGNKYNL